MGKRIVPKRRRTLYFQEHREACGLTQEQVADRLGVAAQSVYRWEAQKGRNRPDTDTMAALAEVYNIEPEDFYYPPGRPTPNQILRGQESDVVEQAIRLLTAIRK